MGQHKVLATVTELKRKLFVHFVGKNFMLAHI